MALRIDDETRERLNLMIAAEVRTKVRAERERPPATAPQTPPERR